MLIFPILLNSRPRRLAQVGLGVHLRLLRGRELALGLLQHVLEDGHDAAGLRLVTEHIIITQANVLKNYKMLYLLEVTIANQNRRRDAAKCRKTKDAAKYTFIIYLEKSASIKPTTSPPKISKN